MIRINDTLNRNVSKMPRAYRSWSPTDTSISLACGEAMVAFRNHTNKVLIGVRTKLPETVTVQSDPTSTAPLPQERQETLRQWRRFLYALE
jgi:hypothetical protein